MSNKIEKKNSIIGGGEGGGQARHGNFHHVFTFFNLKPSLKDNSKKRLGAKFVTFLLRMFGCGYSAPQFLFLLHC